MKIRVLLVLPLKGGSLSVGKQVAEALRHMKNIDSDIFATEPLNNFYEKSFSHIRENRHRLKNIVEHINLAAMAKVVDFRPDLVMVMALSPISPWFVERIKQLGVLTAQWFIEDFRYYPANPIIPGWQIIAPHYNHFFTIQRGAFHEALSNLGINNFHYLPTGCNPKDPEKLRTGITSDCRYSSDICFVGHPYPNRIALFKSMDELDITLWGPGWSGIPELNKFSRGNGNWVDSHEETKIISEAKIGLNVHSSLNPDEIIHMGDFLNPRVFTIAACNTFQVVDNQEPLHEVFEIGREVAVYHDMTTLKDQLHYFLDNKEERGKIAKRALNRVLEEHTYEQRIKEMLRVIGLD
jgi:spore maturation protein CgeB